MKVSVSLPDDDIEFLDEYAERVGMPSRSAVLHKAIRFLRASELGSAYAEAWDEWTSDDENAAWESLAGDGLGSSRDKK